MPTLKKRETKTIKLDTIEGGEVEVYTSLTAADAEKMAKSQGDHPITAPLLILIKDWNLEGESGKKLSINETNIGLLDLQDVNKIADECGINDRTFLAKRQTETG